MIGQPIGKDDENMAANGISEAYWDVRIRKGEHLPFDFVTDGSTALLLDDQSAGVAFFDKKNDRWVKKDGTFITREVGVWL